MFRYTSLYFDNPPVPQRALDLWLPETTRRPVSLFFVHGGGWHGGTRQQMHAIMHAFYKEGYPVASVDYRLAPGATLGEQLADVREGMAIARAELAAAGLPTGLALYGSSAGGHLALLAGLAEPGACGEKLDARTLETAPRVAGIIGSCAPVTFEPWDDIFPGIWSSMERAVGTPYEKAPELYRIFSPETHARDEGAPLLFLTAECEHLFPNDLTEALAGRLSRAGRRVSIHRYRRAEHGFFYDVKRNAQKAALCDCLAFLETLE
ncbi:MAG TPA: alpha/beta hydrolase [Chthoniobacteraceae bacterium]|nr:alpha/beta hydrolase [Chthoniobacteraceae bacterium]